MDPMTRLIALSVLLLAFWVLLFYTMQKTHKIPVAAQVRAFAKVIRVISRTLRGFVDVGYRKRIKLFREYTERTRSLALLNFIVATFRAKGIAPEQDAKLIEALRGFAQLLASLKDEEIALIAALGAKDWGDGTCPPEKIRAFLVAERAAAPKMSFEQVLRHSDRLLESLGIS